MGRRAAKPASRPVSRRVKVQVTLDGELARRLAILATLEGCSVSDLVARAVGPLVAELVVYRRGEAPPATSSTPLSVVSDAG